MEEKISWEGHFVGLAVGMVMAFVFRESGPQRPKFQYEIEKELGIEPPDFEGMYLDELRRVEEEQRLRNAQEQNKVITDNTTVIYHYRSNPLTNDTSDK